ncbi:MAG: hypothetical protein IK013_02660 [Bacteroidales bacterium]|nr:hypothetical protein [Bacteroidales bacterium]
MKKTTLLLVLLCLVFGGQAQRFTSFSTNPDQTVEEMKVFFSSVPKERQKEASALLDEFNLFWTTSVDYETQEAFIEAANKMVKKKMRPIPHFQALIHAYSAFVHSDFATETETWNKIVDYHTTHNVTQFQTKMQLYVLFFKENVLNKEDNVRWVSQGWPEAIGFDKEPFVDFKDVDLVGYSNKDSLIINNVSGRYFPATLKFQARGGKTYWERAGLGEDVYAEYGQYTIDLRFPHVVVEHALFHYPQLFSTPIRGRVEDKAMLPVSEDKAVYPRFLSDDKTLTIKNLYKDVDYRGGFDLRGASIYGTTTGDTLAFVTIFRDGKPIISASSHSFLIKPTNLLSEDAKVSIYLGEDSIYHPAANFKYDNEKKYLLISRPKQGVGRSPFFDSYHKLDITVESVQWNTEEARIEFKPIVGQTSEQSAFFESQNYFDKSVMHEIEGYNNVNPLYTLWQLFNSAGYEDITIEDVIRWFNKPPLDIKAMMIDFAARGFVEYDVNQNHIRYRSKIARYLNNQVKKKDYDYIRLESKTHYASLDLLTNDLKITGCDFFVYSDPQIVNVYPSNEVVTVKKNRDMTFSGRVIGGLFDFVAHNCYFDYDRFQVDMKVIDTLIMYVEDKNGPQDMYGDYQLRRVRSAIEEISGILYIDAPGNKSGMTDYPEYPIFEARKGGKVFYDQPYVLNGVYKRDRFYYAVNQFRVVNLDNFEIDSMKFTGALVSGGIFPDIAEPLQVRPDFSLGFRHKTAGLPMYAGRGKYQGLVDLSNRGLRGRGNIDYVTSHTTSDSLVFYLDSTNGSADKHIVDEQIAGTEFPPASVNDAYMHWEPYKDRMFIHSVSEPLDIFKETKLAGNTEITPHGMYGAGTQTFGKADITSKRFSYKHHELLADTANLRIYDISNGNDNIAFSTDNYRSHINFETRKGNFKANGNASEVFFVKNEFKAKAHEFDWDPIDSTLLRFKWEDPYKDVDINNTPSRELVDMRSQGNELYASDLSKGFRFTALSAEFDFTKNVIYAHGVRYINVGDAAVIPHDGEVVIRKKATIDQLKQSRILAGRDNKYHELYDCNVRLQTATKFYGNGYYDYVDENKLVQQLYFDTVYFMKETFGEAKIPREKDFQFSDQFGFDGRAELHSTQPFLSYFGGVEIRTGCDSLRHARMKILQQVDPNNIMLQVHERTKDMDERKVVVAIASSNQTGRIYTAFGVAKDQFNDAEYINVFGYITYDKETHEFKAASKEKLMDPTVPGNIITLSKDNCVATGTGKIDMGTKLGRVDFVTNGTIVNYITADSAEMHLTTSIDFFFNDESMKLMNKALENSTTLNFVDVSNDEAYDQALYNILGKTEYERYTRNVALGNQRRLPEKLQVRFLFSNIDFQWDKDKSTFKSQTTLPLIICGSKTVYKMVPGRIVIEKRGSRNKLYLYFEFDEQFYYFQFDNNVVSAFSSDKNFNDAIKNTKPKNKSLAPDNTKGLPSFSYKLGNRGWKNKFVKNYFTNLDKEEDEEEPAEE